MPGHSTVFKSEYEMSTQSWNAKIYLRPHMEASLEKQTGKGVKGVESSKDTSQNRANYPLFMTY